MMLYFITALSDTSFTRGVNHEEFSLDEGDDDVDTTAGLLSSARQSVNISDKTSKRSAPEPASGGAKKSKVAPTKKTPSVGNKAVNFLNSDKWEKEVRPPHLMDDDVFNSLSVESASLQIMNWTTTKAMMTSNELKESKAMNRGGREKPDAAIKMVKIEAGDDDSTNTLHKQRFAFRTPLQAPKDYWHLVPLRWKEINKSLYLENVGMDNVCSPKTLELLHDRSSPIEIKMFLTLNISVGRAGVSKKQNLRTLEDGTTEVVSSDDWLSPTNICQLIEAIDNLVAIWTIMWPGEWSMVAMRRAVTKHLAFGDIQNVDLRKKMLEAFINEVLSSNASLAARGKPPMEFDKLDKFASKYMDNKKHFEKSFKIDRKEDVDAKTDVKPKGFSHRQEISHMRSKVGNLKSSSRNQVCLFFNTSKGCVVKNCRYDHSCCFVKADGQLCSAGHKLNEHVK
jgi:hypothetical protein